jgi:hypothetical protein
MSAPADLGNATVEARLVFAALLRLSEEQRALVLCWFCRGCARYVGPGDHCNCERDE